MPNKHMKRYSALLVAREMHIKAKMRYYFISTSMTKIKQQTIISVDWGYNDREKLECSFVAGGNVKQCRQFAKQFGNFSKFKHGVTI